MSEENLNVSNPIGLREEQQTVSQQPAEGGGNAEPGQGTATEFLTREEAERWKEDILRQAQSLTDKAASKTDKKLREELKKLDDVLKIQRENGIDIPPQKERELRRDIYDNVMKETTQELPGQLNTVIPNQGIENLPPEAVARAAVLDELTQDVFKEVGVVLEPNDPEASMVDQTSPAAFLKSVRAAVEKKKQRVNTPVEARIASINKGQPTDLENEYLTKKNEIHGDVDKLIALKKEYRKKGLQID